MRLLRFKEIYETFIPRNVDDRSTRMVETLLKKYERSVYDGDLVVNYEDFKNIDNNILKRIKLEKVKGDLTLLGWSQIPTWLKNVEIEGSFLSIGENSTNSTNSINKNSLIDLSNCPQNIGKDFDVSRNRLKSLAGCPNIIYGSLNCSLNLLEDLTNGPDIVHGAIYCISNRITTLVGMPKCDGLNCTNNKIVSLEGCANSYIGMFDCSQNRELKTLEGCPEYIGRSFVCTGCTQLEDISKFPKKVGLNVVFHGNKITLTKREISNICICDEKNSIYTA